MRDENLRLLRSFLGPRDPRTPVYAARFEALGHAHVVPGTGQWAAGDPALATHYGALAPDLPAARLIFDGGVYDGEGQVVTAAIHRGGGRRHVPAPTPGPGPTTELPGNWLWGGVLHSHFGHFLTESLGRLWAWPRIRVPLAGVLWLVPGGDLPRRKAAYEKILKRRYVADILERLGIPGDHQVVSEPLRPARLFVSSQLMMNASRHIGGHAAYRSFVRRLATEAATDEGRRIYVSRAGVDSGGRFVGEEAIEAAFAAAGWTVLRPERLGIAEQIVAYETARELVFAEGSALHLFALVARPDQRVGILSRRVPPKDKFEVQLRAHGVREVATMDAVGALLLPTRRGADGAPRPVPRKDAEALLDPARLEAALVEHGFIEPGSWRTPSAEWFAARAEAICAARTAEQPQEPYAVVHCDASGGLRI